eukprot:CAMPEP_0202869854 /NCGR_PEP_ID=MMETSP1391-20130828/13522_1 /ASSEMBLY_ACC=CAM_ASM_000867 /TAXON_ID=1034604 /ORGANISM="Chlamydomonas leiostraca, Strain SAG 11-49" /LENGTH=313 /DNA_ID=CAMNT_0049550243 /DNA_START=137 /DNA_END=1078 /DNA_ORIENTATION=+
MAAPVPAGPAGAAAAVAPSWRDYTDDKWWDASTVAVVTGANKGIGAEIARLLAQQGLTVVVGARDEAAGKEAAARINELAAPSGGRAVPSPRLDLADRASVDAFAAWLESSYGTVHVLVNNAGMAYKGDVFGPAEAAATMAVNYHGTVALTEAVLPLLAAPGGRIVTVSSRAGLTSIIRDPGLRKRFTAATTTAEVDALVAEFLAAVKADAGEGAAAKLLGGGVLARAGWPRSMYGTSKLALSTYCRLRAGQLSERGVSLDACCPGWCATDMSSWGGNKTAAQGADTPVWLALRSPKDAATGGLWGERAALQW